MIPAQFGPTSRIPNSLARATISSSCFSFPTSEKPAVMTIAALAPARPASSMTEETVSAGDATTTRSTGRSISAIDLKPGTPSAPSPLGLTA